jgi:2-haloacid dehalogenase
LEVRKSLNIFDSVTTLTFDCFGTILNLQGSLSTPLDKFLQKKGMSINGNEMWTHWRYRQRIEQYQDNFLMMGHSGYLEVARKALLYVLRQSSVPFTDEDIKEVMEAWQYLSPFPEAVDGLKRLKKRFRLVALSNGNRMFLDHLAKNRIKFDFDEIISVEEVGYFKPHPAVYRATQRILGAEPYQLAMVSANTFDVMGARASGYRGIWVDRYNLPFEETPYREDLHVHDFTEMADALLAENAV